MQGFGERNHRLAPPRTKSTLLTVHTPLLLGRSPRLPYEANPIIPLGDARNTCDGYAPESAVRTVAAIAPVAGAEWKRYYDDVTWIRTRPSAAPRTTPPSPKSSSSPLRRNRAEHQRADPSCSLISFPRFLNGHTADSDTEIGCMSVRGKGTEKGVSALDVGAPDCLIAADRGERQRRPAIGLPR